MLVFWLRQRKKVCKNLSLCMVLTVMISFTLLPSHQAQFRIYLQKCEAAAQIMNTKQRVKEEKEAQKKKIEMAKEKIASYRQVVKDLAKYKR